MSTKWVNNISAWHRIWKRRIKYYQSSWSQRSCKNVAFTFTPLPQGGSPGGTTSSPRRGIARRSQSLGMKWEKVCWHHCHSVPRISVIWHPLWQGRAFPKPSGWSPPAQRPQLRPWRRNATVCCYMTGNEGSYQIWPSWDCKNQFNKPKILQLGHKKRDSANVNNRQIKIPI